MVGTKIFIRLWVKCYWNIIEKQIKISLYIKREVIYCIYGYCLININTKDYSLERNSKAKIHDMIKRLVQAISLYEPFLLHESVEKDIFHKIKFKQV